MPNEEITVSKYFSAQITLGEMLAALCMVGGLGAFAMKFEGRMVHLESAQQFQGSRIDKIESVLDKQTENQAQLIQMLQKTKP